MGGLKVTTSKYYTPNGENIHGTGITPDKDDKKTTVTVKPNTSSTENKNNNGSSKLPKTGTANSAMAIVTALGALIAGIKLTKRNKK